MSGVPDEGIESYDELAHASDETNLARLAGEALGEGGDDGIMLGGHHRGHVEGVANKHTSGLDTLGADLAAGAAIEGSDPDQRGNLATGQGSEFGQQGDQGGGQDRADRRHAAQAFAELGQIVVLGDQLDQAAVELGKRPLHRRFARCHKTAQAAVAQVLELVDAVADGVLGVAPHQQMLGQTLPAGIAPELAFLRVGAGELGDGAGIEAIGLGQPALQLSKAAHPQRIEPMNDQAGLFQHFADLPFVATAGLHGDQSDAQANQPSSQAGQASPVIAHRPALARRRHMHVQLLLADIDASQPYHIGHLPLPSLWVRALTRATVRADEDDGVRTLLRCGLCPRDLRSSRRRVVAVPAATTGFAFTPSPRHKRPSPSTKSG